MTVTHSRVRCFPLFGGFHGRSGFSYVQEGCLTFLRFLVEIHDFTKAIIGTPLKLLRPQLYFHSSLISNISLYL